MAKSNSTLRAVEGEGTTKESLDAICGDLYDLRAIAMAGCALAEEFSDCSEHNAVSRVLSVIASKAASLADRVDMAALEAAKGGAA